ncbi:MAG: transketolase family protein [Lachnospiraceae bacterium]|nr:transketolase family protein [Lachnospiraceae bacterium]
MEYRNCRAAYGEALRSLGEENKNIVVLEADLGNSTMSKLFGAAFPERYFQMGIAEQNMASVAAGLSFTGKIPFINSFAVFSTGRPYDQIRSSICIPGANVKICGSSAGLSDYGDGKTHQSVDDISLMRGLPHMTVFSPVDAVETEKAVRAMAEISGPCYIRINRNDVPVLTRPEDPFAAGKMSVMREGTDIVLFATGYMVWQSLLAADLLAEKGISAKVVNVCTIKPLDEAEVLRLAEGAKAVLTAEEHSIYGGLGSAVLHALRKSGIPVDLVGIEDTFGTSGENYEVMLRGYHLMPEDIAARAEEMLR